MQMVVASRLTDGRVVFMTEAARWVESIEEGAIAESPAHVAKLLEQAEAAARASAIVDPYAIDVTVDGGLRRPTALREAIRAFGPTIAAGTRTQGGSIDV